MLFAPGLAPATFRIRTARILREAMDCEQVSFVLFNPSTRQMEVVFDPFFQEMVPGLEGFGRHMASYPCFNCDPTTNGGQPFLRSDFLRDEEFYDSAVYHEGFKIAGISDHAAMLLPANDSMVFFLGMEKRDGGTFGRQQRCRLHALQPHLTNARLLAQSFAPMEEIAAHAESFTRAGLSHREADVLTLIASGKANSEIALILGISLSTVKGHVTTIFNKFGVGNRHAAILRAQDLLRPPAPQDTSRAKQAATCTAAPKQESCSAA